MSIDTIKNQFLQTTEIRVNGTTGKTCKFNIVFLIQLFRELIELNTPLSKKLFHPIFKKKYEKAHNEMFSINGMYIYYVYDIIIQSTNTNDLGEVATYNLDDDIDDPELLKYLFHRHDKYIFENQFTPDFYKRFAEIFFGKVEINKDIMLALARHFPPEEDNLGPLYEEVIMNKEMFEGPYIKSIESQGIEYMVDKYEGEIYLSNYDDIDNKGYKIKPLSALSTLPIYALFMKFVKNHRSKSWVTNIGERVDRTIYKPLLQRHPSAGKIIYQCITQIGLVTFYKYYFSIIQDGDINFYMIIF